MSYAAVTSWRGRGMRIRAGSISSGSGLDEQEHVMRGRREFRFGVVAGYAPDMRTWTELVRRAEDLGFDTVLTPDPLGTYDPLTVAAAAAAVTSTLRLGTFVLVDRFRDARMLSWQAQTLHAISGGRFELGIGTGRPDAATHLARLGGEFGSAGARLERLADTVATLNEQPERPPLLLAAGGPKMRELAAAEADIVTMAWMPSTTEAEAEPIVRHVRHAAGERAGEVELAMNVVSVGDEPAPWLERFLPASLAELRATGAMAVLPAEVGQAAETIQGWRERLGISYITINSGFMEQFAPIVATLRGG